eukprot:TRINITY_DN11873_c0_g1_i1.p1 TRINITY_DN11873_c0_g1~~TRINITY_DN11873_c0_g1_i1.p1  ORF type:complete len:425 (-),score=87.50 TRINITY_DN11873_c0_g1_i1:432-1706(-)
MPTHERFGEQIPFCEPYWYQGFPTAYYHEGHVQFRKRVRDFVEADVLPNIDKWIKTGYPRDLHEKAFQAGVSGIIYDRALGGTKPDDFDAFYELILIDELARTCGGNVLGQLGINSMALPPVIMAGPPHLKDKVVREVIQGRQNICLMISEPHAGSDVASIRATAERDGDHYVVNGQKKWITGGTYADWFTTAVRTGPPGSGAAGISLLLIPANAPGVSVRKMSTQFDTAHSTTFVTLEDVRVPVQNIIGPENAGFMLILRNFNHERFVIAVGAMRSARMCYEESMKYALVRETFGKKLASHQVIRAKLAEMARMVEALQDNCERIAYAFSQGVSDARLGGQCALLKVNASRAFEFCAREASQIFGGASIVREGRGMRVERMYREVRASAIPGGSEEILMDLAIRQVVAKAGRLQAEKAEKAKL